MADADLVHLISLSLGAEPRGVVNFNYLHTLLHEIVRRLVEFESASGVPIQRPLPRRIVRNLPDKAGITWKSSERDEKGEEGETDGKRDKTHPKSERGAAATDGDAATDEDAGERDETHSKSERDGASTTDGDAAASSPKPGSSSRDGSPHDDSSPHGDSSLRDGSSRAPRDGSSPRDGRTLPRSGSGYDRQTSKSLVKQTESSYSRSACLAMAANEVESLDRKLINIEVRLNAVESLPEMLEQKASNSGSTPVSDLWNFANIDSRVRATENNMAKVRIKGLLSTV